MNRLDVLVLNGSPGVGKSTLADAISEQLREADIGHALMHLDELTIVIPWSSHSQLVWKNLAAIWPNYIELGEELGDLKVIIPALIDTKSDVEALRAAAPARSFAICALTAPLDVLRERVTIREPNEYWQGRLREFVDSYNQRKDSERFGDFRIDTSNRSIVDTAIEIVGKVGWQSKYSETSLHSSENGEA